ncbi:MAG: sigma-70 family RNA polymerase sigma factor [Candidatus Aminicenantes bacterium]|nr:sigma-70 family RNA polymerase sigma factor [Candidatus Aminicenantes bacterium]
MSEDRELVKHALQGDRNAFEMLVLRHQQPLFNYLGRLVGERETALDFTQEVFLRAFAKLESFRPEYKFTTWLYRIASNCVIDHWRKKNIPCLSLDRSSGPDGEDAQRQAVDPSLSVVAGLEQAELRERIERGLERLPPELRELFVLRHVSGFSYDEIAAIKGQPSGTVKSRVFQAKETLRRMMEETP